MGKEARRNVLWRKLGGFSTGHFAEPFSASFPCIYDFIFPRSLISVLKMEAADSSETFVPSNQTIHHIPEGNIL
jgi:hypothetical protein